MKHELQLPAAEGMPETYDASQVNASVRQLVEPIQAELVKAREDLDRIIIPSAPSQLPPNYANVKTLYLRHGTGNHGTTEDSRAAIVERVEGTGLAAGMQRFRIQPPLTVPVAAFGPMLDQGWLTFEDNWPPSQFSADLVSTGNVWFTCVTLVTRIPHDLGRIPEFFYGNRSAGRDGPTGQRVTLARDGGAIGGAPDDGDGLVCDIEFLPIFGINKIDIERSLKFLFAFAAISAATSEHEHGDRVGVVINTTSYSNPIFREKFLREMVTTDRTFGGILVATTWGWPTFHGGFDTAGVSGGFWVESPELIHGGLRDEKEVNPYLMGGFQYGGLSKAAFFCFGNRYTTWTSTQVAADLNTGFTLEEGTVDFTIG